MNALRGIPLNDIVYAIPIVVWLTSFGLARFFPAALFQRLCLRFPLVPSPPSFPRADMDLPENVDAVASAMAAAAMAANGGRSLSASEQRDIQYAALGAQRRRFVASVLRYPLRLLGYWRDVLVEDDGDTGGGGGVGLGGRVLDTLLRCVAALCVHANRASLVSSVFSYLNALSVGKPCSFRYEAIGDMAGAVVAAVLTNAIMLFSIKALNHEGVRAPLRASVVADRPALHWIKYVLLPALRMAVLLLNTNSLTFRFGFGGGADRQDAAPAQQSQGVPPPRAGHVPGEDAWAEQAQERAAADGRDYAPATWARAAGAVEVCPPRTRLPPMAYLCGGESLSYAFSGFRFAYRGDLAQLRGAAWSYWMDSFQSYVSLWLRRGASAAGEESGGLAGTSSSSVAATSPFTAVDPAARSVYFTSASSDELNQQNILAFLVGCGVGFTALQGPVALQLARRTPVLRLLVNAVSPPPLPAIDIPEGLMEATLTDLGVVRLYYHRHGQHHDDRQEQQQQQGDADADDMGSDNGSIVLNTEPLVASAHPLEESTSPDAAHALASGVTAAGAESRDYVDIPVPPHCFCPITRCLMRDPVRTVDGFTYDRDAITTWLRRRASSPMTNLPLPEAALTTNHEVYAQIEEIVRAYKTFAAQHHRHRH